MTLDILADRTMIERRRGTMAVLAQSATSDIAELLATIAVPEFEIVRPGESGLVMLRGRVGGDGAPFNLGEAAVSRSAVRLSGGEVGIGYVLGRDTEKARVIAICDALVQTATHADELQRQVISPLSDKIASARLQQEQRIAATRVDFYTLVRGEG